MLFLNLEINLTALPTSVLKGEYEEKLLSPGEVSFPRLFPAL